MAELNRRLDAHEADPTNGRTREQVLEHVREPGISAAAQDTEIGVKAMTSYVAWYGKKRETLNRRVHKLRLLLQQGAGEKQLTRVAEEVRLAKVRALRAIGAQIAPRDGPEVDRLQQLDEEIRHWQSLTLAEIIETYRKGVAQAE